MRAERSGCTYGCSHEKQNQFQKKKKKKRKGKKKAEENKQLVLNSPVRLTRHVG